jgi:hypothetical protein
VRVEAARKEVEERRGGMGGRKGWEAEEVGEEELGGWGWGVEGMGVGGGVRPRRTIFKSPVHSDFIW